MTKCSCNLQTSSLFTLGVGVCMCSVNPVFYYHSHFYCYSKMDSRQLSVYCVIAALYKMFTKARKSSSE